MSNINKNSALNRVFEVAGCEKQTELANFLGIKQSSVSDAKKRNRVPAEWLIKLLRLKGINPEWILTGRGSKLLVPDITEKATQAEDIGEIRPPHERSSQELLNELVRRALHEIRGKIM